MNKSAKCQAIPPTGIRKKENIVENAKFSKDDSLGRFLDHYGFLLQELASILKHDSQCKMPFVCFISGAAECSLSKNAFDLFKMSASAISLNLVDLV